MSSSSTLQRSFSRTSSSMTAEFHPCTCSHYIWICSPDVSFSPLLVAVPCLLVSHREGVPCSPRRGCGGNNARTGAGPVPMVWQWHKNTSAECSAEDGLWAVTSRKVIHFMRFLTRLITSSLLAQLVPTFRPTLATLHPL
jgi:hypothetical protein